MVNLSPFTVLWKLSRGIWGNKEKLRGHVVFPPIFILYRHLSYHVCEICKYGCILRIALCKLASFPRVKEMGALCCCPRREDVAEFTTSPTESINRHCFCIRRSLRVFMRMYGALFHTSNGHELVSAIQTIATPSSTGLLVGTTGDTFPDTYRPPLRSHPYDVDRRYIRFQSDGSVSGRDKAGMSHLDSEESEPLWQSNIDPGELIRTTERRNAADYDDELQGYKSDSPDKKQQSAAPMGRVEPLMWSGEDEDVCPTCLDGYTKENPKISTQCGHHFHLGCIYEWMERSNYCPVCDQEMIFNESP